MIAEAIPLTIYLAFSAFFIALFIGVVMGLISALKYNTALDMFILAITSLGYSLPSYVIAMAFALIFAWFLGSVTGLNIQGSIYEIDELGNDVVNWKNLILPALSLGIRPLSVITQITRSSVLDIISAPYIKTAKAKGLAYVQILWRHVLANAKNPIGTASLGWLASLLTGAFFVETVFNYKGLGSLTVNALLSYDLPLILGCILCSSVMVILINIATDLFYKFSDPRI
jgi:peptide/nickel transport system permease protein